LPRAKGNHTIKYTLKILAAVLLICITAGLLPAQAPSNDQNVLLRRYHEGEKLTYQMKGVNEAWHYEIQADGVVIKDSASTYYEEYRWSNLISDNQKAVLSPATLDMRQQVTLDPNHNPSFPNLANVDLRLIGPVTDMLTFYADLLLAEKTGQLKRAGDHFYFKRGTPNSWADGNYVTLGEDSIDFDFTLKEVNKADNTAILIIRHVPPEKPEVKLPADWMHKPVADTPNNWVQIQKTKDGQYLAAAGKETFDVEIKLSLADGKILSATIDNPLQTIERECEDVTLTKCGDPKPHPIRRQIELTLQP
jgi:hypothetical protein